MTGAYVERIEPLVVLERDDGACGICGGDVDPFDFHVDHVVALAAGGAHAYWNVQASHPDCNVRKHVAGDVPPLPFTPLGSRSARAMVAALEVKAELDKGLTYDEVAAHFGENVDWVRWRVKFLRSKGVEVITRRRGHRRNPHLNRKVTTDAAS